MLHSNLKAPDDKSLLIKLCDKLCDLSLTRPMLVSVSRFSYTSIVHFVVSSRLYTPDLSFN